jgi:starch-binding outer membrane protein, SusD/RagB family
MKTINNNIKYCLLFCLMLSIFASCTQDFLEFEPYGVLTDEVYYSTIEGISEGVVGTYASLNPQPAGLHNLDMMYIAFGTIASDEAEAGGEQGGNDLVDFQNWDQGNPQPSESRAVSEHYWGYTYKTILRANSTINGIAKFREKTPDIDAQTEALLKQYEGEMEFLLAFSHFKLVQVYGGVPIVDHALGSSEYGVKRNTVAECLVFVQERLKKAIDVLPQRSQYSSSNAGRITKGAAQSLLAKAYLYESSYADNYQGDVRFEGCENKYALALQAAEEVINSNEYELVGINGETFDTYWNQNGSTLYPSSTPAYRYIFSVNGENSKESIFEVQSINDGLGYMLSRGTYLTIYTAVRNVDANTFGWGFNCPTQFLYHAYPEGDLRREVTIGKTGDPILVRTGWGKMDCLQSPTNLIGRKYEASPEQYWGSKMSDGNGPNNFPYIRYADVVLMAAEAALKTGNNDKALSYVNMIRKRARNGAATGEPAQLSSVSIDDIANERLLELALEGHRFFDLVRMGKQEMMVDQPLQNFLGGVPQQSPVSCNFTVGVNEFFPIPQVEVINSNNNLVQYNGY